MFLPDGVRAHGVRPAMKLRILAVAAAVSLTLPAHAQPGPELNLPALMATLRQVRSSTARFTETRYSHLLNQAQHSSGRLIYVAPDQLQKQTIEPRSAKLTINGDRLTIEQQGQPNRAISLHDNSEVGALVESIRATLAGDLPALTRYFNITPEGDPNNWRLTLVPREPKLRELVASIQIRGERGLVRAVQTTEADGDRTDMAVIPETQ
jgi:outer membrane lipoprotein-sorting protein